MGQTLTSRERLMRTIRGEPVDRVPIFPPIPWSPWWKVEGTEPQGWQAEPSFTAVRELVEEHCDSFAHPRGLGGLFDRRFLLIPGEHVEVTGREQVNGRHRVTYAVHTPRGDLTTTEDTVEGIHTTYYVEPLLKDKQDVERLLSVPFRFDPPDLAPFLEDQERLGEAGVTQIGVSTPLVCVSRMFHFDQFLEWCASENALIERLIDIACERTAAKLSYLLEKGVGPVFWFGGSEQATPPMMSPRLYDQFVVKYDGRLWDMVHEHGGYVHCHCHGKIRGIFDRLLEMGADTLDPVEPPPDGDIEMAEAKRWAKGRMVLMGNIEFRKLEFAEPDEIEELVRRAIVEGGREHCMLYPSATAIAPLSARHRDNAIRYIEAGLRYGAM